MTLEDIRQKYPDIDVETLFPLFPRVSPDDYSALAGYSWEDCHAGTMGSGALFLAADMAGYLTLQPGKRVLDLGPGKCASSIFLASHFGVNVAAVDLWIDPSENWERIESAGLSQSVIPLRLEAHALPFAHGYFDAIFCMNAYFYFGTDDLYLSYLTRFLRQGGRVVIGGPCYATELTPDTPSELLEDDSYAWHSPAWWRDHFEKTGLVSVVHCAEHPKGREFWLDEIRWFLEERHPRECDQAMRDMILHDMVMTLSDSNRFVTHFILAAEKT